MHLYSFTPDELTQNANLIKEHLLVKLIEAGEIDKDVAERIGSEYIVLVHEKSNFGSWVKEKLFGTDPEEKKSSSSLYISVVKTISPKPEKAK